MTQDRPARRFDEPPAYEDPLLEWDRAHLERHIAGPKYPRSPRPVRPDTGRDEYGDPDIAARSHLGVIVIVSAVVVLVVIAAALLVRGFGAQ